MSNDAFEFIRWCLENGPFDGCELDGGDVQAKAAALGFIEPAKDRLDWWVYSDKMKALRSEATGLSPDLKVSQQPKVSE